ncbi:MAG: N-acetylglucosamine-6-phosphate deacetylase [Candidatus Nanopelagicales bacterium]
MKISAARAFVKGNISPVTIEIDGQRILDVSFEFESGSDLRISEADGILVPGLIDLQINGGFGIDFQQTNEQGFETFRAQILRTGVTGFLPTLITASHNNLLTQLEKIEISSTAGLSDVLGVHLEGPYISQEARGTHDKNQVRAIDLIEIQELIATKKVRILTLAPELEQAMEAIEILTSNQVLVSLGHSMATSEQTAGAVEKGARMITHIFNAQTGIHHRESGMALQALVNPDLYLGAIADLHHLRKEIIQLIFQTAAPRTVLVTDAIAALGMPEGTYDLGNQLVEVNPGQPPKRKDGVIAGSAVRLDQSIKNVIDCGVSPELAIAAATSIPANALGLKDRGEIKKGHRADLALLSESGLTSRVWHLGEEVSFD